MILSAKEKQRHGHRKQTCRSQGEKIGWDELGDWDGHVYTIDPMYKIGH